MKHIKLLILPVFFMVFVFSAYAAEKHSAYIAAAADGPSGSALLSGVAGRAPYFIMYDKSGKVIETVQNPFRAQPGAGPKTAEFISGYGIKIFLAQSFGGGRMPAILTAKGITLQEYKGTADEAVKRLIK